MRMPTGELLANSAFLMAGQLAWCLRSWLSALALPKETIRWEWKWFRQAFVYVAAKITHSARRAKVYLAGSHRFAAHLVIASQRLQTFAFQLRTPIRRDIVHKSPGPTLPVRPNRR